MFRLLAGLGLLQMAVMFSPVLGWWNHLLARPWQERPGEILIVLGGEQISGGYLGPSSYWRAVSAVRVWERGGIRQILISGGGEGGDVPIAEAMKKFLVLSGVPEALIETETRSTSTRENALHVASRLQHAAGRKLLLTSDYHMLRAYRTFRSAGLEVIARPVADAGKRMNQRIERWPVFLILLRETAKLGYYYARGWL